MIPTSKELARIKHLAHRCYGYVLSDGEATTIWQIARFIKSYSVSLACPKGTIKSYWACYAADMKAIAQGKRADLEGVTT